MGCIKDSRGDKQTQPTALECTYGKGAGTASSKAHLILYISIFIEQKKHEDQTNWLFWQVIHFMSWHWRQQSDSCYLFHCHLWSSLFSLQSRLWLSCHYNVWLGVSGSSFNDNASPDWFKLHNTWLSHMKQMAKTVLISEIWPYKSFFI